MLTNPKLNFVPQSYSNKTNTTSVVLKDLEPHLPSLENYLSQFTNLKKSGSNFIGLCPVHEERTPSFVVNPNKGICKCFGCDFGASGVVGFHMKYYKVDFKEALHQLASQYAPHLTLSTNYSYKPPPLPLKPKKNEDKPKIAESRRLELLGAVYSKYKSKLSQKAINYLKSDKRGLIEEICMDFGLFSIDSKKHYNQITKHLEKIGFSKQEIKASGFSKFFVYAAKNIACVVIPYRNEEGQVIGFQGRKLGHEENKKIPKYLLTFSIKDSQGRLSKNVSFFNFESLKRVKRGEKVFFVESAFDAMILHQYGFNALTYISTSNLELLLNNSRFLIDKGIQPIYAGDNDKAGQKIRELFIRHLDSCGVLDAHVIDWKDSGTKDITDYIVKHTPFHLYKLVNKIHLSTDLKIGQDEHIKRCIELFESATNAKHILLNCSTGMGKTTYINNRFSKLVNATPFVIQAQQFGNRFGGAVVAGGERDTLEIQANDKVNCVYDSLEKVLNLKNDIDKISLFADESHHFSRDYGHRKKAIKGVLDASKYFDKTYYASGTCEGVMELLEETLEEKVEEVVVRRRTPKKTPFKFSYYKKGEDLKTICNDILADKSGKAQFLFIGGTQSKLTAKQIKGILNDKLKIRLINADEKSTKAWNEIVNNSRIDESVDLYIVNSVIEDGVDILNENIGNIRFLNADKTAIAQFYKRFRNGVELVTIYAKNKAKGESKPFYYNMEKAVEKAVELAKDENQNTKQVELLIHLQKAKQILDKNKDIAKSINHTIDNAYADITANHLKNKIIWSEEEEKYVVDIIGLHHLKEAARSRHYAKNAELLKQHLIDEFDFVEVVEEIPVEEELVELNTIKEVKQEINIRNEALQQSFIKLLDTNTIEVLSYMTNKYMELGNVIRKNYSTIKVSKEWLLEKVEILLEEVELVTIEEVLKVGTCQRLVSNFLELQFKMLLTHKNSIELLKEIRATRKMDTLRKRWSFATYTTITSSKETSSLDLNLINGRAKQIEKLYEEFSVGNEFTSEEAFKIYEKAFKRVKAAKKMTKETTMQMLKNAFVLNRISERIGKKVVNTYTIKSVRNFENIGDDFNAKIDAQSYLEKTCKNASLLSNELKKTYKYIINDNKGERRGLE